MVDRFFITAMTYIVSGMLPALIGHYIFRPGFLGGIWAATIVGLISAFIGGLIDVFLLTSLPDLISIAGVVDAGPPLILATLVTILFALVSRSNSG